MQVFGLIGDPVGHSLSPPMHEAAYDALGMDARYVTFEPDGTALEAAVEGAAALGVAGLNVTVPFKEDVAAMVDVDDLASRVGAVNTVDFGNDRPTGHNTDVAGVTRAFDHHDVRVAGRSAVVVGAGGAGRAATVALDDEGATVHVANRTVARAEALADDVTGATAHGLDALERLVSEADVLVNATSVGMSEEATPVPGEFLHGGLVVLDAVYRPLETRLLADAADCGATTIDGAWMLLYQGVESFELWTGRDAPVDVMNTVLRNAL